MIQSSILKGEFVNLRPLHKNDAPLTFRWRHEQRAKLLNQGATTVELQAAWIESRPLSEYNFIIELKNKQAVGMLSLCGIDLANQHAEPARFLIGEEDAVRGMPVAVEAMKLLYQLAFETLGLVRVFGIVAANNSLVIKWQKFLGMREEGRFRNHLCQDGNFVDGVLLGLLVEEYRKTTVQRMKVLIAAQAR